MTEKREHNLEDSKKEGLDKTLVESFTKQVAKGGGITFSGQLTGKALKFLFQILLTRVLGAGAYGLYALGFNVVGTSQTFSTLGLHNAVVRFGSMYRSEGSDEKVKGTLISALVFSLLASIVGSVLIFSFADFLSTELFNEPELTVVLKAFAFALPFYTWVMVLANSARAFKRMEYDVGLRLLLHPVLTLLGAGFAFGLGYGLLGVVYGFVFSSAFSALAGLGILWRLFPPLVSSIRPSFEPRTLLGYSLAVLMVGFAHLMLRRTDRFMLGALGGARNVGIYNAAAVMATQGALFLRSFNAIFSPIIAELHNQERKRELGQLLKSTTKWIFALTWPIFLIFLLFPKNIMSIFGPEFAAGWTVLVSLGLAQLVNASVGAVGYMLTMTGHQKLELANSIILGLLNIGLNFILIQTYGILGAAVATGVSLTLINLVKLVEVYTIFKIHPYKFSYWKPIMAGAVAFGLTILIRKWFVFQGWLWLLAGLIFGVLYAVIYLSFGLAEEDRLVLRAVKMKLGLNSES